MSGVTLGAKPRFVVDGQAPMRQCLHPEACNKDIELPEHYNYFHDLRKEFVECYSSYGELSTLGIQEMLQCILLNLCRNCYELRDCRLYCASFLFYLLFYILSKYFSNLSRVWFVKWMVLFLTSMLLIVQLVKNYHTYVLCSRHNLLIIIFSSFFDILLQNVRCKNCEVILYWQF